MIIEIMRQIERELDRKNLEKATKNTYFENLFLKVTQKNAAIFNYQ